MMLKIDLKADDYFKWYDRLVDIYQFIKEGKSWIFYPFLKDKSRFRCHLFHAYFLVLKEELFSQKEETVFIRDLHRLITSQSNFMKEYDEIYFQIHNHQRSNVSFSSFKKELSITCHDEEIHVELDGNLETIEKITKEFYSHFNSFDPSYFLSFLEAAFGTNFNQEKVILLLNRIQKEVFL